MADDSGESFVVELQAKTECGQAECAWPLVVFSTLIGLSDCLLLHGAVVINVQVSNDRVAFTRCAFEAGCIEDLDAPTAVLDQPFALKLAGGQSYGGSTRTQHRGQKFLSDEEVRALHAIADHQEPAREALFGFVKPVACRELSENEAVALHALQNTRPQFFVFEKLVL